MGEGLILTTKRTLKSKICYRVKKGRRLVYLREDFADLTGYGQVGRALRQIVEDGLLVKIGQGLYAKTRPSTINPAKRTLVASFKETSREALTRLGIKWRPGDAEIAYNEGLSTQIPVSGQVILESRTSRIISYGSLCLEFQKGVFQQKKD